MAILLFGQDGFECVRKFSPHPDQRLTVRPQPLLGKHEELFPRSVRHNAPTKEESK